MWSCNDPKPVGNSATSSASANCATILGSAIDILQPERMGITSDQETASGLLNQWALVCANDYEDHGGPGESEMKLAATVLSQDEVKRLSDSKFKDDDCKHVRTCMMLRTMVDHATAFADSEVERVVNVFEYVVRNVQIPSEIKLAIPQSRYAAAVFGLGSAEDRAWLFADMLRQLRIDSVILRSQHDSTDEDTEQTRHTWLVGVVLEREVYLFDMRLGTPIPSPRDDGTTITVRSPATLKEVLADDDLLRRLDIDERRPYRLTAEQLKNPKVEIVGYHMLWAPRIGLLQSSLVGEHSTAVYDPLEDVGDSHGLVSRLVEAGEGIWTRDDITVWGHPEKSLREFAQLDLKTDVRWQFRWRSMEAPVPIQLDPESNKINVGTPQREMRKVRMMHVLGDYSQAIQRYTMMRIEDAIFRNPQIPIPPEKRIIQVFASSDSFYWSGVCQMEKGEFGVAANTFRQYLNYLEKLRTFKHARWSAPCRGLLAYCLAQNEQFTQAIEVLDAVDGADPHRDAFDLLIRRWGARAGVPPAAATSKAEPTSESSAAPKPNSDKKPPQPARGKDQAASAEATGDDAPVNAAKPSARSSEGL